MRFIFPLKSAYACSVVIVLVLIFESRITVWENTANTTPTTAKVATIGNTPFLVMVNYLDSKYHIVSKPRG